MRRRRRPDRPLFDASLVPEGVVDDFLRSFGAVQITCVGEVLSVNARPVDIQMLGAVLRALGVRASTPCAALGKSSYRFTANALTRRMSGQEVMTVEGDTSPTSNWLRGDAEITGSPRRRNGLYDRVAGSAGQ